MIREMKISGLFMDPATDRPVVELTDTDNETSLHIWIGLLEAVAIASELQQFKSMWPSTHDAVKNLLTNLEVIVDRVEVHDLRENTFCAWIYLKMGGKETRIDARPSEALAIALLTNARIYVTERLFVASKLAAVASEEEIKGEEGKKWTEILQNLSPENFGKYKM
jgi:bifunctional DNase/RNase